MKNTSIRTIFFVLVIAIVNISAYAQTDGGPDYPDFDIGGGGGGGDAGSNGCDVCASWFGTTHVVCVELTPWYNYPTGWMYQGQTGCVAHNAIIGPNGCTFTGSSCYGYWASNASETAKFDEKSAILWRTLKDKRAKITVDEFFAIGFRIADAVGDLNSEAAAKAEYEVLRSEVSNRLKINIPDGSVFSFGVPPPPKAGRVLIAAKAPRTAITADR